MEVQSFPASQPVTGRVPGDAGLVEDGRGEGVAGGAVLAGVPRGEVTGGEAGGADVLGAGVAPVPCCAPGEGVPPQAASAVTATPATASRAISEVLMLSACAGPGGPERSQGPLLRRRWSLKQDFRSAPGDALMPFVQDPRGMAGVGLVGAVFALAAFGRRAFGSGMFERAMTALAPDAG